MITKLDRIADIRVRAAIERSAGLEVVVTDRPPGAVVALVTCTGGCGIRHLLDGERHQVVLHHDGTGTCNCVATSMCKHLAALVAHEGGALPPPPPLPVGGFVGPCVVCGKPGTALLRTWPANCEDHPR